MFFRHPNENNIMGDVKNLQNKEAIEKIQELANEQTCHFCTFTNSFEITARPMYTQKVEDDGCFWFFSSKSSEKNQEIKTNSKVQLLFGDPGKSNYLSVVGEASIVEDKSKIDELYTPYVKAWFQGGKDDPEISLIKISPSDAYYWDTKHGKLISFFKIMASIVSGKTMDDGIEGTIEI